MYAPGMRKRVFPHNGFAQLAAYLTRVVRIPLADVTVVFAGPLPWRQADTGPKGFLRIIANITYT
jgi:hypothetical protein